MVGRVKEFADKLGSFISEPRLGTGLPPELTILDVGLAAVGALTPLAAVSTPAAIAVPALEYKLVALGVPVASMGGWVVTAALLVWLRLETNPALEFRSITLGVPVVASIPSVSRASVACVSGLVLGGDSIPISVGSLTLAKDAMASVRKMTLVVETAVDTLGVPSITGTPSGPVGGSITASTPGALVVELEGYLVLILAGGEVVGPRTDSATIPVAPSGVLSL